MKKVFVSTSTFSCWKNDTAPGFVYDLNRLLVKKYNIAILAPHYNKTKKFEMIDNLKVHRFQYFFLTKQQKLLSDNRNRQIHMRENYSWNKVLEKFSNVYKALIEV